MGWRGSLTTAQIEAEKLLSEQGIDKLPVDPMQIAVNLGITLMPMPANSGGASGMLLHVHGQFGIAYPTHIKNEGFKRFSVGHELGHYRLPGHLDAIFDARGQHASRAGFSSDDRHEREADQFAAHLLMPTGLFTRAMGGAGRGIRAIEGLADMCLTSLEATAIRFAQCSTEPVAVIRSSGKTVDYAVLSSALMDFQDLDWPRRGSPLPARCVTRDLNTQRSDLQDRASGRSMLQDWFGGTFKQQINEEAVRLGLYGKTLTVLSGMCNPDDYYEDNDPDDDDLQESWTPRFKR